MSKPISIEDVFAHLGDVDALGETIIRGHEATPTEPFGSELLTDTPKNIHAGSLACTIVTGAERGDTDATPPPAPPNPRKDLNPPKKN
ncbi:MAG: hypothetical protein AAB834_00950 [Patescibacteria group bacterium]